MTTWLFPSWIHQFLLHRVQLIWCVPPIRSIRALDVLILIGHLPRNVSFSDLVRLICLSASYLATLCPTCCVINYDSALLHRMDWEKHEETLLINSYILWMRIQCNTTASIKRSLRLHSSLSSVFRVSLTRLQLMSLAWFGSFGQNHCPNRKLPNPKTSPTTSAIEPAVFKLPWFM